MTDNRMIYFDHQSTTPVDKRVLEAMMPYFSELYGNPSSHVHKQGVAAGEALDNAREKVAGLIHSEPEEIIFTSSATESNNLAVKGFLQANQGKGKHIVASSVEHYSILNQFPALRESGYEVTFVGCDKYGMVDPMAVRKAMRDDTALITIQTASSEIGTIQKIADIGRFTRKRGVFFHSDAAIAAGNIPIDVEILGVDAMTCSAHNMYGPKGVGALYVRNGNLIKCQIEGGMQEFGMRSGTENLPGIVGMGKACELAVEEMTTRIDHLKNLQIKLWDWLEKNVEFLEFTGHPMYRIPGHVSFWIKYIEGESLLLMLNIKGVMCASGSACSSNLRGEDEEDLAASHVLTAIGVPVEYCSGSLTVSMGKDNTVEEVDHLISALPEVIARLLAMSPLYSDKLKGKDPYAD
ncbi:MAG: cysteine desulfurase [candidate division Zixibacteria bacterium]|nr:cysteine desulfurase [candidate division Zixibacteria bacterium]MBU2624837.1 cysteine desulfurase [candidate division Zixibacteria bacterium]